MRTLHAAPFLYFVIPTLSEVEGEESAVLSVGTVTSPRQQIEPKKLRRPEWDALYTKTKPASYRLRKFFIDN